MTAPIEVSWGRVTAWLAREAPESFARLSSGASDGAIIDAETSLGLMFPADLTTLLQLCDGAEESWGGNFKMGARFLPGGHRLLSVGAIVEQTTMLNEILGDLDAEMAGSWWHPQWVCFAAHIAADGLAIDLRPGPGYGAVGEFRHDGFTEFDWGPSLAAVIDRVADCLENGVDFKYFRPVVEDGCLGWDVVVHGDR